MGYFSRETSIDFVGWLPFLFVHPEVILSLNAVFESEAFA
jgi:hypothetical protein